MKKKYKRKREKKTKEKERKNKIKEKEIERGDNIQRENHRKTNSRRRNLRCGRVFPLYSWLRVGGSRTAGEESIQITRASLRRPINCALAWRLGFRRALNEPCKIYTLTCFHFIACGSWFFTYA